MKAPAEPGAVKDTLRSSEVFRGLTEEELDYLLPLCSVETCPAGAAVFSEGEQAQYLKTVKSGRVALETELALSRTSSERATIDVLERGSTLCWSALMEHRLLTSSGRCLEDTELVIIDGDKLKAILNENPRMGCRVANNLVGVVASRLEHTKRTMARTLSVIFHDLKAPLAAAESYNRLLIDGFVGELTEEQQKIVRRSSKRLADLLDLVGNMIDFSRVDLGDFRREEVSLLDVIRDCVETICPLAQEKGLAVTVEAPSELPTILGTASRLKQVVTNLLSNAVKFTESGGVTVRVRDRQDRIEVAVMDTGIGIPAEGLAGVFDGFYSGLNIEKRGAGLGLSISKRVIESHGGRIWATSPCPETGKGSKFTFILPKNVEQTG